jgi:hypothetical protein
MKIVEFPSDIMDASKDIQFSIMVIHGVPISDVWNFSIIFQPMILIVTETEHPSVVKPGRLALASKDINA